MAEDPTPSRSPGFFQYLAYYGFFYLIFLAIIVVGYPLAQQYAKPVAALVFPVSQNNSLLKNVVVMSGMYWCGVVLYTLVMRKKPAASSDDHHGQP